MAHLKHFFRGTTLFSTISPDYERNLKEELFNCFKYIGIPFDLLYRMPTRDRKFYILRHNKTTEGENTGKTKESNTDINSYARQSMGVHR